MISLIQPKHESSDTARPSKRQKTEVLTHVLPLGKQKNPAFVPLLVSPSCSTTEPEATSSSTPSDIEIECDKSQADNTDVVYDMNEDLLRVLRLFDCCSTEISERPANNCLSLEDIVRQWNLVSGPEGMVDDYINIDEDSACGSSDTKDTSHQYDTLCEGKKPNKKRRRSVSYIADDRKRTKAHSDRCKRIMDTVMDLDAVSRPFIFLYIARPESVLSKRGKSVVHMSPALQEAFDFMGNSCPVANIEETIKSYIVKQTPLSVKVQRVQAELLTEQRRRQAAEAQLASLTQQ
ncbi:uncharacterized protein HD556DRAFT_1441780 [Suillus plorans]|uniref:Uncharacterized protein n=1 Tax=Suillus plorans TaxID=116603 RepID=A0A9P7AUA9_9AGAM|nr:uncharacterized protein HD556DRAFT_1441780 [Suillus plorans]KAG1795950.1 hypothetical protein HD556DRAFT_1441780 [Suillus plorans]